MSKTADSITAFDALIEIPRGSRNKYEYDFNLKKMRYDRMLYSAMRYPIDYGFIPNTYAPDGDPLDVLLWVTEPTFPGCLVEVKPIGVMFMEDGGDADDKILCVPVADPIANKINSLADMNPHTIKEIEHFFKVYKDLEGKKVVVKGWDGIDKAKKIIADCYNSFANNVEIAAKFSL